MIDAQALLAKVAKSFESADYQSAYLHANNLLFLNPENVEAYLYLFLIDKKIKGLNDTIKMPSTVFENRHFVSAKQFAKDILLESKKLVDLYTLKSGSDKL